MTKPQRVLVVGLLPNQAAMIRREFGQRLALRFWKNENTHKLQAMSRAAGTVAVMAAKVAHQHIEMVESVGVKPRIVMGGLTSLRDYLSTLFHKETH